MLIRIQNISIHRVKMKINIAIMQLESVESKSFR
jgi:hypothetical protein